VDLAERFLGSADLHLYNAVLWAKFAGVDDGRGDDGEYGFHEELVVRAAEREPVKGLVVRLSGLAGVPRLGRRWSRPSWPGG
jgi:hypothetical protein